MTKKVDSIIERNEKFGIAHLSYATDIATIPNLNNNLEKLPNFTQKFQAFRTTANRSIKGLTETLNQDKTNICKLVVLAANRAHQFAIRTQNIDLKDQTNLNLTKLKRTTNQSIVPMAENLINLLNENINNWEQMNITQTNLNNIADAQEKFKHSLNRLAQEKQKIQNANNAIADLYKENMQVVRNEIMPTIRIEFGDINPQLVNTFEQIIHETQVHNNHLAIIGRVVDDNTGKAITYPEIEIPELELKKRLTSEDGQFRIPNINPKKYVLRCTHAQYTPVDFTFIHTWGKTTRIEIRMKPIIIQNTTQQPQPSTQEIINKSTTPKTPPK